MYVYAIVSEMVGGGVAFDWYLNERDRARRHHGERDKRKLFNFVAPDDASDEEIHRLCGVAWNRYRAGLVASRADAVERLHELLEEAPGPKNAWHFGKVELRVLFDFIYGGPPQSKEEEI